MIRTTAEAIVVRVVDYGEADRVATLLLRAEGKVAVLARGARRSRKRFAGLEVFACGQASLRETRGELWALDGFEMARGFPHLGLDVARMAQAAYGCELVRELLPPHHGEPRAYDLLRSLLTHLDAGEAAGALAPAYLRVFELSLLEVAGVAPAFDRCVGCERPLLELEPQPHDEGRDPDRHLDLRRGGIVCEHCSAGHGPGERTLGEGARRLLARAQRLCLEEAPALRREPFPREAWEQARDTVQAVLREHLGHPLRSVDFIAKLNAAAG